VSRGIRVVVQCVFLAAGRAQSGPNFTIARQRTLETVPVALAGYQLLQQLPSGAVGQVPGGVW